MSTAAPSTKLDQSLDDILATTRKTGGRGGARGRGGRRAPAAGRTAGGRNHVVAPVGGVKKSGKNAPKQAVPSGPAGGSNNRILISNLPRDVTEDNVKEYITKTIGPPKRVEMSFGPGGVSRGVVTVTFQRADHAKKAVTTMNGTVIDGKNKMKVDIIVDATTAANLPGPKGLSERIAAPKSQPKSAAATKTPANGAVGGTRGKAARGRGAAARAPRNARPAKKTAEELDSEMADYWQAGASTTEGAAAAQPAGGDAAMDDEIL